MEEGFRREDDFIPHPLLAPLHMLSPTPQRDALSPLPLSASISDTSLGVDSELLATVTGSYRTATSMFLTDLPRLPVL